MDVVYLMQLINYIKYELTWVEHREPLQILVHHLILCSALNRTPRQEVNWIDHVCVQKSSKCKFFHVLQGYAYILTHPGQPCVFYDHLYEWGEDMKKAIVDLVCHW